jgi:hypothetical protein
MKRALARMSLLVLAFGSMAQQQPTQTLKAVVSSVAGTSGTNEQRTRKLVRWINTSFTWSYTDYQKRTVDEIGAGTPSPTRRAFPSAWARFSTSALKNCSPVSARPIEQMRRRPTRSSSSGQKPGRARAAALFHRRR